MELYISSSISYAGDFEIGKLYGSGISMALDKTLPAKFNTKDIFGASQISEDKDGNIWVLGINGAFGKFDGKQWEILFEKDVSATFFDSKDNLWISAKKKIMKKEEGEPNWIEWDNKEIGGFTAKMGMDVYHHSIILEAKKNGDLWFLGNGVFHKYDGMNWTTFDRKMTQEFNGLWLLSLDHHPEGSIILGQIRGVSIYDGSNWKAFKRKDIGVGFEWFSSNFIDKNGSIWVVANKGKGISKFDGKQWEPLDSKKSNNQLFPISCPVFQKSDGAIFVASETNGIYKFEGGNNTLENWNKSHNHPTDSCRINVGLFDLSDNLISFCSLHGIHQHKNDKWNDIAENYGTIYQDDDGVIWTTTFKKDKVYLIGFFGNEVKKIFALGYKHNLSLSTFFEDSRDNIWVGLNSASNTSLGIIGKYKLK